MAKLLLDSLKPKTAKVAIRHPATNEPTSLVFHVCLPDSSVEFRNLAKKLAEQDDPDESNMIHLLATVVVGWEDNGAIDEPYTPDGCLELLSTPENQFMVLQLLEDIKDKHHFYETEKKRDLSTGNGSAKTLPDKTRAISSLK